MAHLQNAGASQAIALDSVYAQLTSTLRDVFDDETLTARPDLTADDVAGWDSFAHLRLIFSIEKAFGISFAASEITSLKNVGELAGLIATKVAK